MKRRRPSPRARLRRNYLYGTIVAAVFVALIGFGYSTQNGLFWKNYYVLNADVRNAANMAPHTIVRIDGTIAGQVTSVRVHGVTAELQLELSPSVGRLRSSTVLEARAQNALGQYFVELIPGRTGRVIPSGGTLVARQSRPLTELDQVLSILDPLTRVRTQQLLGELGAGVLGRAGDVSDTLANGTALLTNVQEVLRRLNATNTPIGGLVETLDRLATTTDPVRQELANGFHPEALALAPLRIERRATRGALDAAPATLAAVSSDLPAARRLLSALSTLAIDARPLLAVAPAGLTELGRMLPSTGPGLASLNPTLTQFDATIAPTLGLLRALQPSLAPAVQTLQDAAASFVDLASRPCELSAFLANWGGPKGLVTFGNGGGAFVRFKFVFPELPLAGATTATDAGTVHPYPSPNDCRTAGS